VCNLPELTLSERANYFVSSSGPPGRGGMNPRTNPPTRVSGMGPMGSFGPAMRGGPPNSNLGSSGGLIPPVIAGQRP
jgi:hypothetical protein